MQTRKLDPEQALPNLDMVRLRQAYQAAHPTEEHSGASFLRCVHGVLQRHAADAERGVKAASEKERPFLSVLMVTMNHVNEQQGALSTMSSIHDTQGFYIKLNRVPEGFEALLGERLAGLDPDYMAVRDTVPVANAALNVPGNDRLAEILHNGGVRTVSSEMTTPPRGRLN